MTKPSNIEALILRRFAVVSQTEVAKQTGMDNTFLSRFLHGERGLRIDQLGPVLDAIGLSLIECDGEIVKLPKAKAAALFLLAKEALQTDLEAME